MNFEYRQLLDASFAPESRVWIYQSSRLFSMAEALAIEELLGEFILAWKSHGVPVKGAGYLFFGRFLILMADEDETGVGGCSTDSSVRFIKEIESKFGVNMFDRTALAFIVKDKIELLPMNQLQYAITNGFIDPGTLYFDNLVQTKKDLENKWIVPIKSTWLAGRLKLPV